MSRQTTSGDRKLMDRLSAEPALGRLLGIIATTYEMQPEFFETDFLPTLFGLGAWDDRSWTSRIALEKQLAELETVSVYMDAHPYRGRPRSLRVELMPTALRAGRSLHAKVLFAVYDQAVRLIVGSANLTEPGYRRNREIVAVFTATAKRSHDATLIAQALRDFGAVFSPWTTTSTRQLEQLALERLDDWEAKPGKGEQWFAWGGGDQPVWSQFVDRWPAPDQIERITVVSPFWSEERNSGPVTKFVETLKEHGHLKGSAQLKLLTEAAPDGETTYKPRLPESFRDFDGRAIGVDAQALAVDPRVPPDEVEMAQEFVGKRSLHAKIVLLEGSHNSLVYIGSANFTNHGWGFLSSPSLANVEAGLIVRRAGDSRGELRGLIPKTIGDAVPLAGAAAGRLALPEASPDELPWPAFLREIVLSPSADGADQLDLVITLAHDAEGPWRIALASIADHQPDDLLRVEKPELGDLQRRVPLSNDVLRRILREQEVQVAWWQCPEGRAFPVNVDSSARLALPISPESGHPDEYHLIAYYQGRITWEDLFPDPDATPPTGSSNVTPDDGDGVDTSRIQSYIVREFVEAIKGIKDDLKAASTSPKACMRLALLGTVSPVALARHVTEAAERRERTSTGCAFQIVEILACLDAARHFEVPARLREDWRSLVDESAASVAALLGRLMERYPNDLTADFRRYAKTIRDHYREPQSAT